MTSNRHDEKKSFLRNEIAKLSAGFCCRYKTTYYHGNCAKSIIFKQMAGGRVAVMRLTNVNKVLSANKELFVPGRPELPAA